MQQNKDMKNPSAKLHGKQVIYPPACRFPNLTAI
jgi:hypothetical protein